MTLFIFIYFHKFDLNVDVFIYSKAKFFLEILVGKRLFRDSLSIFIYSRAKTFSDIFRYFYIFLFIQKQHFFLETLIGERLFRDIACLLTVCRYISDINDRV